MENKTYTIDELKAAAEQGDAAAQMELGCKFYYDIEGGEATAVDWWQKAAEQGNLAAQLFLWFCYKYGDGVLRDRAQAKYWHNRAKDNALGKDITYCFTKWGFAILSDDCKEVDLPFFCLRKAVRIYQEKAGNGDVMAQLELFRIYNIGGRGVEKDATQFLYWTEKVAELGNSEALSKLVDYYATDGDAPDKEKELYWFGKYTETKDGEELFEMSWNYEGNDNEMYEICLKKAAEKGNVEARKELGIL